MQESNGKNNQLDNWQQQANQPFNKPSQDPNQSFNQPINESQQPTQTQQQVPQQPRPQQPAPQGMQGGINSEPFRPYAEPHLDLAGSQSNGSQANPYQAPNSLNINQQNGQFIKENNSTWYHTSGRIGRLRYLAYSMVTPLVLNMGLGMIAGILVAILGALFGDSGVMVGVVLYFLAMLPGYAFQLIILPRRRLHDLNKSGWFLLIMLVPLVNVFFIFYLCLARGDAGENDYGMPNRENQWWHYFLGLLFPVMIAIIGILAAIAIPAYEDYVERSQTSSIEFNESFADSLEELEE